MGCQRLTYHPKNPQLKVVYNDLNNNGNTSIGDYRYGFQGQEKDDEVKEIEGGSINYKYRMHDPRIGRFFAVDPLARQYPHNSPYAFSENVVISHVELEGLEKEWYYDKMIINTGESKVKKTNSYQIIVEQGSALWNYLIDAGYALDAYLQGDGDQTEFGGFTLISENNGLRVNNAPIKGLPSFEVDADLLGAGKGYKNVGSYKKLKLNDPKSIAKFGKQIVKALDKAGVVKKGPLNNESASNEEKENTESISGAATNAIKNSTPKTTFQKGVGPGDGYFYYRSVVEGNNEVIYMKHKTGEPNSVEESSEQEFNQKLEECGC